MDMKAIEVVGNTIQVETGFISVTNSQTEEAKAKAVSLLRHELGILPSYEFFAQFIPDESIFPLDKPDILHHERNHAGEVLVLSVLYMMRLRSRGVIAVTDDDIEAVAWACVYHDSQRVHDGLDEAHGDRVATAIEQDLTVKYRIPQTIRPLVCRIIREHVPDDTANMHPLSRLFKDMDNMLWIRTEDFDPQYLRIEEAIDMLPIAHALHAQTAIELHTEKDGFIAALRAAGHVGIIV